ncbi:Trypanosome variant surface glycoprotein C-terminal domain containing protein [Trypanosoma brucei equiperdum]|uniref:Trypanosome variant surface glycoprotein C-terminal domain containing protein n=1 Tax=Trypanosoma brucei equiperdum TaxID=630700 RepID=A0A3L6L585_9TRYP|nr:Trypanosome variant surface glycoprotein C-terminal domain containing protein [Trypanosoma brucei equiperdum]RHW71970.1 Trypanosome variant surface glycoprotein C-terminal domain containing protein [Trypanosoma brucei equiperdum]RHW72065.1 Trypanosome variant surface glycoprotein C-terminal domain containing protein [Trypanosoma brucei equiperdum]RHW72094.1 Trypanosome variant surface glycoprotein C-terminal domain containing protein [Trypanosoma brucei equiperdum]
MTRQLVYLLKLTLCFVVEKVRSEADDTATAHRAMCSLSQAAAATYSPPQLPTDAAALNVRIQAANMSIAPETWKALFDPEKGSKAYDQTTGDNRTLANRLGGKAKWNGWFVAFAAIKEQNIATKAEGPYPKIEKASDRAAARTQLFLIAETAAKLTERLSELQTFLTDPDKNKIDEHLKKALFGGDGKLTAPALTTSLGKAVDTWNNLCGGDNIGKSISGDFICLCSGADAATKQCSGAYDTVVQTGGGNPTTAWPKLLQSCGDQTKGQASPETITAAISQWQSALTQKASGSDNAVWLGKSSNSAAQCNGSDGNTCIVYSDYFKKSQGKPLNSLPWLAALQQAAQDIRKAEAIGTKAEALHSQLQALAEATESIYSAAATGSLWSGTELSIADKINPGPKIVSDSHKKQAAEETECNEAKDEQEACKKLKEKGCVFDPKGEKDKKCTLNKEAKQALEKAKENEGTSTTVDCSDYTIKEACEAENKDGKRYCGLRSGKDDEDESKKDKCTKGSFLVNKKLNLSMAAAFMCFVTF